MAPPTLPALHPGCRMESLPTFIGRQFVRLCGLACILILCGCATYSSSFGTIENQLKARQYEDALKSIEAGAGSKTDRALYLLNKGMVLRMKHDFSASNKSLEAAKQEMERLYTESVSEHALSFLLNDTTVSYAGEDYEQVLVHLYMALNYLELGQRDEARVEALQVDIKLREIADASGSKIAEDALSRYLTGVIYEDLGEWSDAMIAYRKAYEAYKKHKNSLAVPIPDMLKHDLVRLAQRQGLKDELARYRKEFDIAPEKKAAQQDSPEGELVFVLNNSLAPIKRQKVTAVWAPGEVETAKDGSTTVAPPVLVDIALPYYESRSSRVVVARILAAGKQAGTQMMEDIDAIARASLDSHMAAITARAIARAVAKVSMQKSVQRGSKKDDEAARLIGSLIASVATAATEIADTRSWLTLPANVQMARLSLPPGSYDVTVELLDGNEQVVDSRVYPNVTVRSDRKTYLTQHSMPY